MSRRVQVLTNGQYWQDTLMSAIRIGMVFRLFEPDGTAVKDEDGHSRWRATADAAPEGDQHRVEAEAVPETEAERVARTSGVFFPNRLTGRASTSRFR